MKITILGGGFGLYGYLPALIQGGYGQVVLPARYQERILTRNDIRRFYNEIEWVSDRHAVLDMCDGVIIALPPTQQYEAVMDCIKKRNISYLLLEKPLAVSPEHSHILLECLESSEKTFRLGYNFRYTDWGKKLLSQAVGANNITWHFCAYHYAHHVHNWKRVHSQGGGALRFYGIHLIAIMAEAGYRDVRFSSFPRNNLDEVEHWTAELIGTDVPNCMLTVATKSNDPLFQIQYGNHDKCSLSQPFQTERNRDHLIDDRVSFLMEGLADLFSNPVRFYPWYKQANLLWHNIETAQS